MQTFLPYPSFERSAFVLDDKRLGKQRSEVLILLRSLVDSSRGWQNHPCLKMWRGYENALVWYGITICREWRRRGFKDLTGPKIQTFGKGDIIMPPWVGNAFFHRSHQSNLLRKNPDHYGKIFLRVRDDWPYVWPSSDVI